MRASRFDTTTRSARDLTSPRFILSLLLVALFSSSAAPVAAQTKAGADSSGISVRVHEDRTRQEVLDRARAKVERARDRAERAAERAEQAAGLDKPEAPDTPEPPEPPDFDHSEGNDLVRFGEDITIPEGKVVEGDVVAIGGSITVLGRVKGDCVAVGGSVKVKGKGVIEGDGVSLGGGVHTSDSASIGGSDVSVGKFDFGHMAHMGPAIAAAGAIGTVAWIVRTLVSLAITLFLAWISLLLFRDRIEHAADVVAQRFGKSFVVGLLGWVLLVLAVPVGIISLILAGALAIVILCITIIGIPVAILLIFALVLAIVALVVGVVYAAFLGYLTGAMYLGRRLFGTRVAAKPLYAIGAGAILIAVLGMVGKVVGAVSFFVLNPVGMAFCLASWLLLMIVATSGLGALMAGRFRRVSVSGFASQWGSTPPPSPPTPPTPGSPTAPPAGGTSDAP